MGALKDGSYLVLKSFMRTEMGLKGSELMAYALVFGFSQDGESWFTGSRAYVAEWLGVSRKTVTTTMASLVANGFVERRERVENGVTFCDYRALFFPTPGTKLPHPSNDSSLPPSYETSPQNPSGAKPKESPKEIDGAPAPKPATKRATNRRRKGYGEYGRCMLTDEELAKLKAEFPDWEERIRRLDEYCESKGRSYKNGLATIRSWARRDAMHAACGPTMAVPHAAVKQAERPTDPLFAEAKSYWQNVMKHKMLDAEHIAALRANEEFMAGLDPRDVEYLGRLEAKAQGRFF